MGAPDWKTISDEAHAALEDWQATRDGDAYQRWRVLDAVLSLLTATDVLR